METIGTLPDIEYIIERVSRLSKPCDVDPIILKKLTLTKEIQLKPTSVRKMIDLTRFKNFIGIYLKRNYEGAKLIDHITNSNEYRGLKEPNRSNLLTCHSKIATDPELLKQFVLQQAGLAAGMIKATCMAKNYLFEMVDSRFNYASTAFVTQQTGIELFQIIAIKTND